MNGRYDPNTVIAFGAAMFAHNSRGSPSTPIRSFRYQLSLVCFMVLINEYLTSQRCSLCHTTQLTSTCVAGEKGSLHGVRECRLCRVRWNRDINSARNMLYLFWYQLGMSGERPATYAPGRAKKPETAAKKAPAKRKQRSKGEPAPDHGSNAGI